MVFNVSNVILPTMNISDHKDGTNDARIPHKDYIEEVFNEPVKSEVFCDGAKKFDCLARFVESKSRVVNITAIRNYEQIWLKHIIDSLIILNIDYIYERFSYEDFKALDIGTGGGFPGLALAIGRSLILQNKNVELDVNSGFLLVDSTKKKIDAVNEVIKECNVERATALWSRVEDLGEDYYEKFNFITARAVAPLPELIDLSFSYLAKNGLMAFYKLDGTDELENSTKKIKKLGLKLIKKYKYELGGTKRVIYVLKKG